MDLTKFDINISNGTCYTNENITADARYYLPCGNSAIETQACCFLGDACLEEGACSGQRVGSGGHKVNVTYIVGCTDRHYSQNYTEFGYQCPYKSYYVEDFPWAAIAPCLDNDRNKDAFGQVTSVDWAVQTSPTPQASTIGPDAATFTCPKSTSSTQYIPSAIFNAPTSLRTRGILPTTAGGSMTWAPNYSPEYPTPTPTYSSSDDDDDDKHGPSSTTIRNICLIVILIAAFLAVVLTFCLCRRKRNKRHYVDGHDNLGSHADSTGTAAHIRPEGTAVYVPLVPVGGTCTAESSPAPSHTEQHTQSGSGVGSSGKTSAVAGTPRPKPDDPPPQYTEYPEPGEASSSRSPAGPSSSTAAAASSAAESSGAVSQTPARNQPSGSGERS